MNADRYQRVSTLVSRIRNARYGDMVNHLEELIETGVWRDYTTPAGTRFEFRPCEFDYFLAVENLDATLVRHAYLNAEGIEELARRQIRLATITGRGEHKAEDRRPAEIVAKEYASDPSGAAARISAWERRRDTVVTDTVSRAARDPERRRKVEAGDKPKRDTRQWKVMWSGERPVAEAIAEKLLKDEELAREVYKILDRERSRRNYEEKRRSEGKS